MKKIFLIIISALTFLYANNLSVVQLNSYYTQSNLSQIYNKLLAYQKTNKLVEVIDTLLNSKKFKKYIYLEGMGKVKVNTIDLLNQLKYFLAGWPKYSNTYFDNNTDLAGIKNILKDSIDNDANFINTPQNVINDMKKSISNLKFFEIANKIEYDVTNKNLKNKENLSDIMKNLSMLINSYVNTLSQIKEPLLREYNEKIKDELEKNYRIYAKTNLLKIMKIFNKSITQNYKTIDDGV